MEAENCSETSGNYSPVNTTVGTTGLASEIPFLKSHSFGCGLRVTTI
jgi:hypothetical protein